MAEQVVVVNERCCGLDIHKKSIEACVLTSDAKPQRRRFTTMTRGLQELVGWLQERLITVVGMESTGVYWKPVVNILEGAGFEPLVVNAHHIKAVPGRKTDVKDAEWIATLIRYGLVRASFIPDREQRELRELARLRTKLTEERTREVLRLQKVLEGANIKLSSVATNVLGVSGRAMIEAMIGEVSDPAVLTALAQRRLKQKSEALLEALTGSVGPHQRVVLALQLRHIDFLDEEIAGLDAELSRRKAADESFREALELLTGIPGVGPCVAQVIAVETGLEMHRFPTAGHLSAWAGLVPGNNASAGKRKSGRTQPGNQHLRTMLVQAACAVGRSKDSYLSALYHRLSARRGAKRAAIAVARKILEIAWHMLTKREPYRELGATYLEERRRTSTIRQCVKRLEALGLEVKLVNPAA